VRKQTRQLTESYKADKFIMVPGARGIAPPNLHIESQSMYIIIYTKHYYYYVYKTLLQRLSK